ncbi:hypothetical protein H0A36_30205, partial [Endozoicomonas sp. SM1973]
MGMNNGDFSHFYTQAPKYYFDKPIHVHGELYAGSNYGHRVYHEGYKPTKVDVGLGNLPNAKTDAINENNSNILATARAVKYYFDKPIHVHGELYAGSNYGHRVYHEGYKPTKVDVGLGNLPNAKTDAINENNSN